MSETFARRVRQTPVPADIALDVGSALRLLNILNALIRRAERPLLQRARDTAAAQRLMTVPGVGPITALTFVATIDSPDRFRSAAPVTSYLGLVPIEYSSGELQRKGPISRAGDAATRALLVQAAWSVLRARDRGVTRLRTWMLEVARRRGRRVAVVGLARRLARILFAMWRDETVFDSRRLEPVPIPA